MTTTSHPTAEQVGAMISRRDAPVRLKAVMDALDVLVHFRLVRRCCSGFGPVRYDGNIKPHPHMVDSRRDLRMDLPIEMADRLGLKISPEVLADIQLRTGFKVVGFQLELVGLYWSTEFR